MTEWLRHGIDEVKRRWQRRSLTRQLVIHEAARSMRLGQLGEQAAQSSVDLHAHEAIRDHIRQLAGRAGDVSAASNALQQQRNACLDRRRAEDARFAERRQAITRQKTPIDQEIASLTAQQRRQQSGGADVPVSPTLADDLAARTASSQQLAGELAALGQEASASLKAIDDDLAKLDAQLRSASANAKEIEKERWARCVELGTVLHEGGHTDASLAQYVKAVADVDAQRANTQAVYDRSLAVSNAMPANAFRNFVAVVCGVAILLLALSAGIYAAWQRFSEPESTQADGSNGGDSAASASAASQLPINPMLDHPLKEKPPYVLADRVATAKTEQAAEAALLDLFRTIGVGVYTSQGRPVVPARDKNVYLYDFHVKTLAHTIVAPSYMEFSDYSNVLAQAISKFKEPAAMHVVLTLGIVKRYQAAEQQPDDPANFLVLFIDGLARHQAEPYSLTSIERDARVQISPVQSILLMFEFFMPNDNVPKRQARSWPTLPSIVPRVYADGPCDFIESDEGKTWWGRGVTVVSEAAEESFGLELMNKGSALLRERITKAAELFDQATGLIEAMGDMLILYGIDIKVTPTPYTIHLRHEYTDVDGVITAQVTFDPGLVPEDVVKCGWLIGKQMPPKGPMPDVEVSWNFVPPLQPLLALHPKSDITSAGSEGLKSKTDKSGMSYFPLMASACPDKTGRIEGQDFMAIATARVITANIPTPTMITTGEGGSPGGIRPTLGATLPRVFLKFGPGLIEYFMNGRKGYARFRAEWHKKKPARQYGSGA